MGGKFKFLFVVLMAMFLSLPVKAFSTNLEKFDDFGFVYWYGGEDVSYSDSENALVSVNEYDDIDMFIDMKLSDMKANMGDNGEYSGHIVKERAMRPDNGRKPMIAIVIDDMGVNKKMSSQIMSIKAPVTLSFLPYATSLQDQVDEAKAEGHEIMLHLPWEPVRDTANPGPDSLLTSDTNKQIYDNLIKNLDSFKGYKGVNNHMGSKFSVYRTGIDVVMKELKKRHVFFLDSKTANESIAEKVASEYSIPTTHRNIFLDHVESPEFVASALKEVERIAIESGSAVAIGHPKAVTVEGLKKWLPTLKAKGFDLVPLTDVIQERQKIYNAKASTGIRSSIN